MDRGEHNSHRFLDFLRTVLPVVAVLTLFTLSSAQKKSSCIDVAASPATIVMAAIRMPLPVKQRRIRGKAIWESQEHSTFPHTVANAIVTPTS
jgi:fumarate reductase subunit C